MVTREPDVRPNDRFNVAEAARILGIGRTTIHRKMDEGLIKYDPTKSGRKKIKGSEILRYWRTN